MAGEIANLTTEAPLLRDDYRGSGGAKPHRRKSDKKRSKKSKQKAKSKRAPISSAVNTAPSPIAKAMRAC